MDGTRCCLPRSIEKRESAQSDLSRNARTVRGHRSAGKPFADGGCRIAQDFPRRIVRLEVGLLSVGRMRWGARRTRRPNRDGSNRRTQQTFSCVLASCRSGVARVASHVGLPDRRLPERATRNRRCIRSKRTSFCGAFCLRNELGSAKYGRDFRRPGLSEGHLSAGREQRRRTDFGARRSPWSKGSVCFGDASPARRARICQPPPISRRAADETRNTRSRRDDPAPPAPRALPRRGRRDVVGQGAR